MRTLSWSLSMDYARELKDIRERSKNVRCSDWRCADLNTLAICHDTVTITFRCNRCGNEFKRLHI